MMKKLEKTWLFFDFRRLRYIDNVSISYAILGLLLIGVLIEILGIAFFWAEMLLLGMGIGGYLWWNQRRWKRIATLNHGLGITKDTVYIDRRGQVNQRKNICKPDSDRLGNHQHLQRRVDHHHKIDHRY